VHIAADPGIFPVAEQARWVYPSTLQRNTMPDHAPHQPAAQPSTPNPSNANQSNPLTKENAPNPAHTYERADPKREAGAGRLTNNTNATPTSQPDKMAKAVHHAQDGSKQLNAEEEATTAPKTEENTDSLGWEKKRKD
jgi:hypothetical protein